MPQGVILLDSIVDRHGERGEGQREASWRGLLKLCEAVFLLH